jgi:hypothetical protein
MTSDLNEYLENIIDDLGGLGRFQWILIIIVLGSKISVAWSTLMMTFGGAVVYSIQHYVLKFVSDLRQVGGFLHHLY